jgi:hypothetical protein
MRSAAVTRHADIVRDSRLWGNPQGVAENSGPGSPVSMDGAPFRARKVAMGDLARIEIERDLADLAARRAAEEGLTFTAYISLLLRRSFERAPSEETVLVYDHVGKEGEFQIDREEGEDDQSYDRRAALYDRLFGSRG